MTGIEIFVVVATILAGLACVAATVIFEMRSEHRKVAGNILVIEDDVDGETYMSLEVKNRAALAAIKSGKQKHVLLGVKILKDAGDENV